LRNFGSTPDTVARRCVLGKDNAVFHLGASSLTVVVAQPDERNLGSTPGAVTRRCVLGKDT